MPSHTPRILVLVPYFGCWPEWIEFHLVTCRWNRSVEWLFVGDAGVPGRLSPNLHYSPTTLTEFRNRAQHYLNVPLEIHTPRKLCDLRLAFGSIFQDELRAYDYFGWSDIDVLYGDLSLFLTPAVLCHDVITFNEHHLSGHFTLVRNTDAARRLHLSLDGFLEKVGLASHGRLDEPRPCDLTGVDVYARESFNTPLSQRIPWCDGRFVFPREWQWRDGSLTNDLNDRRQFLYLHFMHWKGGAWPRRCGNAQWEKLDTIVNMNPANAEHGFRVSSDGFHAL